MQWDRVTTYVTCSRAQWAVILPHLSSIPKAQEQIQKSLDDNSDDIVSVPGSRGGWRKVKGLIEGDDVLKDVAKVLGWQLYAAGMPDW